MMELDDGLIYETRAFVRVRRPRNSWVSWNNRLGGGPMLKVNERSLQVVAPQGMMLESRTLVLVSCEASMWRDKVGWAGTPFGRKECIHVAGHDQRGRVEVALTPIGGLEEAWRALLTSGVARRERA